jgi:hypothetical protein
VEAGAPEGSITKCLGVSFCVSVAESRFRAIKFPNRERHCVCNEKVLGALSMPEWLVRTWPWAGQSNLHGCLVWSLKVAPLR